MRTAYRKTADLYPHGFWTFWLWIMNRQDYAEGEVYTPNISNMHIGSLQMIKIV